MNTLFCRLSLAVLIASTTAGYAAADTAHMPETATGASTDAAAAALVVLARADQDAEYRLANHRALVIEQFGESMRVQYGNRRKTVRYDGLGSFVSADGQLRMRFGLAADGNPDFVSLSMPASWQ